MDTYLRVNFKGELEYVYMGQTGEDSIYKVLGFRGYDNSYNLVYLRKERRDGA